ncbi:MAG: beta-N-acetylhexosaminidase, partial [Proteobacteria bacterium]|nr:beta-N-acetylhexosaminidase [Pseudomonadota bacterium]
LKELIASIRETNPNLLLTVDHEGGRVQRFRNGFTELPAYSKFGEMYDRDPKKALQLAEQSGWLMASELLAVGIDFSFAPVLDLEKGVSGVMKTRCFHRSPAIVSELAKATIHGMKRAGMIAVGKHFPGHGSVTADSHLEIPVDARDFASIQKDDLLSFQALINEGIEVIMPAHVIYKNVDEKYPAGFSEFWLQKILRQELHFKGIICSDDLMMEGAAALGDIPTRAQKALSAGCDLLLVCNNRKAAKEVLASLKNYKNPSTSEQLSKLRGRPSQHSLENLKASDHWNKAATTLKKEFYDNPSAHCTSL